MCNKHLKIRNNYTCRETESGILIAETKIEFLDKEIILSGGSVSDIANGILICHKEVNVFDYSGTKGGR